MRVYLYFNGQRYTTEETPTGYKYVVLYSNGQEHGSLESFETREQAEQAAIEHLNTYDPDEKGQGNG